MRAIRQLINTFDHNVAAAIQSLPVLFWEPIMTLASEIGLPRFVGLTGLMGIILSYRADNRLLALQFFLALVGGGVIGLLKIVLRRARPLTPYVTRYALKDFSFPSGHSGGSMLVYGMVAWWVATTAIAPWSVIIPVALGILIFTVGVSRVFLGAHFPSDVIGAWTFCALWLFVVTQLTG